MFDAAQTLAALEAKRALFHTADDDTQQVLNALYQSQQDWNHRSSSDITAAVGGIRWPGALPTCEQDVRPPVIPFDHTWDNHQQARQWARSILTGVSTFAADGSQISASHDLSIPVGVVQIGWFENRHADDGLGVYDKGLEVEILAPTELTSTETSFSDAEIEWRRLRGEVAQIERFMHAHAGSSNALAFFDGSFIASFIQNMPVHRQAAYVQQIEHLLHVSETTQVPLIGYIDASRAYDLSSLFAHLGGLDDPGRISDAALLAPSLLQWGSRSRIYVCARDD